MPISAVARAARACRLARLGKVLAEPDRGRREIVTGEAARIGSAHGKTGYAKIERGSGSRSAAIADECAASVVAARALRLGAFAAARTSA